MAVLVHFQPDAGHQIYQAERFLDTQRPAINPAAQQVNLRVLSPSDDQSDPLTEADLPQPTGLQTAPAQTIPPPVSTDKRHPIYQRTKELQREGHGIRAVARHLGVAAAADRP